MVPDGQETAEDQVREPGESGDEVAGQEASEGVSEAVGEGVELPAQPDPGESVGEGPPFLPETLDSDGGTGEGEPGPPPEAEQPDPKAPARERAAFAQGQAGRAEISDEAPEGLRCAAHGGMLVAQKGKFRWRCDRAIEDGTCMAEPVDA